MMYVVLIPGLSLAFVRAVKHVCVASHKNGKD